MIFCLIISTIKYLYYILLKQIPIFEYADEINDSALFYKLNEIIPQVKYFVSLVVFKCNN